MDLFIVEARIAFRSRLVNFFDALHVPFAFEDWEVITATNMFSINTLNILNEIKRLLNTSG